MKNESRANESTYGTNLIYKKKNLFLLVEVDNIKFKGEKLKTKVRKSIKKKKYVKREKKIMEEKNERKIWKEKWKEKECKRKLERE